MDSRLAKAAGAEPSGPMRNEKLHAVVARSEFASGNGKSTGVHLEVEMCKCTQLQRKAHVQVKIYKDAMLGSFLEIEMSKNGPRCGGKHMSKSKVLKMTGSEHFWTLHVVKDEQSARVL